MMISYYSSFVMFPIIDLGSKRPWTLAAARNGLHLQREQRKQKNSSLADQRGKGDVVKHSME